MFETRHPDGTIGDKLNLTLIKKQLLVEIFIYISLRTFSRGSSAKRSGNSVRSVPGRFGNSEGQSEAAGSKPWRLALAHSSQRQVALISRHAGRKKRPHGGFPPCGLQGYRQLASDCCRSAKPGLGGRAASIPGSQSQPDTSHRHQDDGRRLRSQDAEVQSDRILVAFIGVIAPPA